MRAGDRALKSAKYYLGNRLDKIKYLYHALNDCRLKPIGGCKLQIHFEKYQAELKGFFIR